MGESLQDCTSQRKVLVNLGLSPTQAKIYCTIFQAGQTTVKEISKCCNVAREDVYKNLPILQSLGLIAKHVSSPVQYHAVQPKEAISILLAAKEEQYKNLREQANETLRSLTQMKPSVNSISEELETTFVSSVENVKIAISATKEAKETIDFTTRYNLFTYAMNSLSLAKYIREMKEAADRGIKFRMIIDKPENTKPVSELSFSVTNSKRLVQHKNFEYKYLETPIDCIMIIYDDKKALIETSIERDVKITPQIWTNNPVLVELCKTYFKKHWNEASENEIINHNKRSRSIDECSCFA